MGLFGRPERLVVPACFLHGSAMGSVV